MRPPLSQEQLEWRTDGSLQLTLKNVWKDGTRALVLEPFDILVRLCSAIPPPPEPRAPGPLGQLAFSFV